MKYFLGLALVLSLLGCQEQGPMEGAGEEIDEAIENIGAGGETAANQLDDAIDDAREEVEALD